MDNIDTRFRDTAVASGGLLTWPTALALGGYLGTSRATVGRLLGRLCGANMLRRVTISGTHSDAWLTTPLAAETFGGKPATRFLGRRPAATWTPGQTFRHDQLALLATWSVAVRPMDEVGNTAATEAEIEKQFTDTAGRHIPDGAFIYRVGGAESCVAVEVELSKKSGSQNGKNTTSWARSLAPSILDRQEGRGMYIQVLNRTIDATLLVAPEALARQIVGAVRRAAEERDCEPGRVWWAEPAQNALGLAPIHIWMQTLDAPTPIPPSP